MLLPGGWPAVWLVLRPCIPPPSPPCCLPHFKHTHVHTHTHTHSRQKKWLRGSSLRMRARSGRPPTLPWLQRSASRWSLLVSCTASECPWADMWIALSRQMWSNMWVTLGRHVEVRVIAREWVALGRHVEVRVIAREWVALGRHVEVRVMARECVALGRHVEVRVTTGEFDAHWSVHWAAGFGCG